MSILYVSVYRSEHVYVDVITEDGAASKPNDRIDWDSTMPKWDIFGFWANLLTQSHPEPSVALTSYFCLQTCKIVTWRGATQKWDVKLGRGNTMAVALQFV